MIMGGCGHGCGSIMPAEQDVMSPGVVEADIQIREGDTVIVVDENHRKPCHAKLSYW
jgi:PUA domain protein